MFGEFPYIVPCVPIHTHPPPAIDILVHSCTVVKIDALTLTNHDHSKPIIYTCLIW